MTDSQPVPGTPATPALADVKRVRTVHLRRAKDTGEKFSMLTSYDVLTAGIFDRSGVDVLLVGDSLGNTVLGHESTLPVTLEDMVVFAAAVVRGVQRALVVVDLPFGSYEESPAQAVRSAARIMKETGAHAVKLEGGEVVAEHIAAVVRAGIPVMGHVGFTPQSEHALGGFRIQGRGGAAEQLLRDARAVQDAGCFAVVLEMVSADAATAVEDALEIPTVGIGAGNETTGQVLVWQDMLGLRTGHMPRFVRQYADLARVAGDAVSAYVADVRSGAFPAEEHTYRG